MIESTDLTEPGALVPPNPGSPDERPGPEIDPSPAPVEVPADPPITVPTPVPPPPPIVAAG